MYSLTLHLLVCWSTLDHDVKSCVSGSIQVLKFRLRPEQQEVKTKPNKSCFIRDAVCGSVNVIICESSKPIRS